MQDLAEITGKRRARLKRLIHQLAKTENEFEHLYDGKIDAILDPFFDQPVLLPQAQFALRRNEENLRLFLEQVPAIVWTTDENLVISYISGAALKSMNQPPEQLLGVSLYDLPRSSDNVLSLIAVHLRALKNETVSYEIEWQGRYLKSYVEPYRDGNGAIAGCLGIALDITDQKEAEIRLQKSEQRLRFISARMLFHQEEEKKELAKNLMERVGQHLSAIKFCAEKTRSQFFTGDVSRSIHSLEFLIQMIQDTIEEVQEINRNLWPPILDLFGLKEAIDWLCQEMQFAYQFLEIEQRLNFDENKIPDGIKIIIIRVIQEGLSTIVQSATEQKIQILVRIADNQVDLILKEKTPGNRSNPAIRQIQQELETSSIQEKAELSGGEMVFDHSPKQETLLHINWPLLSGKNVSGIS